MREIDAYKTGALAMLVALAAIVLTCIILF